MEKIEKKLLKISMAASCTLSLLMPNVAMAQENDQTTEAVAWPSHRGSSEINAVFVDGHIVSERGPVGEAGAKWLMSTKGSKIGCPWVDKTNMGNAPYNFWIRHDGYYRW